MLMAKLQRYNKTIIRQLAAPSSKKPMDSSIHGLSPYMRSIISIVDAISGPRHTLSSTTLEVNMQASKLLLISSSLMKPSGKHIKILLSSWER
jgi:hypothetical protein